MGNVISIRPTSTVTVDLGKADPLVDIAARLELDYPGYLVLIQAGGFLHGYNRMAQALYLIKGYKVSLRGPFDKPHLVAGFQVANFKAKLWTVLQERGIPYVVAIGDKKGYELQLGKPGTNKASMLDLITNDVVDQVLADLIAHRDAGNSKAAKAMANPETTDFIFKTELLKLSDILAADLFNMPRNVRYTWGESVRTCMDRLLRLTFLYGNAGNKLQLLYELSADIDMLKHFICQTQRLNGIKFNFEHRAHLAVELGRMVGGLIAGQKARP